MAINCADVRDAIRCVRDDLIARVFRAELDGLPPSPYEWIWQLVEKLNSHLERAAQ